MKKIKIIYACLMLSLFINNKVWAQKTIVEKYGHLKVSGTVMVGEKGDTVQLRGMSLFWSQWMGQYYNGSLVKWLRDDWKCTVVRIAMGVEMGGYSENPSDEMLKVREVIDACISKGIYVIVDYHSHEAHKNHALAIKFFSDIAKRYGAYPNILYEIYNEPLQYTSWNKDIKPYAEAVTKAIRTYDTDNIIIVGTRMWSQKVTEPAMNRLPDPQTMYTLHFYAGTHKQELRDEAQAAIDKGLPLFVTEYGTCDASGNGKFSPEETYTWYDFLDKNHISYVNWSIADKAETASAILPGTSPYGAWRTDELTESGILVRDDLRTKNTPIFDTLEKNTGTKANKKGSK
jgi:endoglucanase